MTDRVRIRVTMGDDGKTPNYELMLNGHKAIDLSFVEVLELALNATSALRWAKRAD